jgi:Glutamyl- and glutaminyl-tRNA synthetases
MEGPEFLPNDLGAPQSEIGRSGYRGRIAPTPTGYLHLGHAATFLKATSAPAKPTESPSSGSKISMPLDADPSTRAQRSRICGGLESNGRKDHTTRASEGPCTSKPGAGCEMAASSIRAIAHEGTSLWRPRPLMRKSLSFR